MEVGAADSIVNASVIINVNEKYTQNGFVFVKLFINLFVYFEFYLLNFLPKHVWPWITPVCCLLASQALMCQLLTLRLYKGCFKIADQRCQILRIMSEWLIKLCHLVIFMYYYEVSA